MRRNVAFPQSAAFVAALLGGIGFIGWWWDIALFKSIIPGAPPIKPNLAVGMFLCGVALGLLAFAKRFSLTRVAAGSLGLIAIVLGLLTLMDRLSGLRLNIDSWFFQFLGKTGTSLQGQLSLPAAFCFVLAGGALLALSLSLPAALRGPLVVGLSISLVLIGVTALVGFLLEQLLGREWNYMGMSVSGLTGSIGFTLLGCGFLALLERDGSLTWFLNPVTTIAFGSGILLVVVAASLAFTYSRRMLETTTWQTHRQEVLKHVAEVYGDVSELASRQRLFIITGDDDLLKGREQLKSELGQSNSQLRELTSHNPAQQNRLAQLQSLLAQRVEWEERLIAARREDGFPAASQLMASHAGLRLSEQINNILREMEQEEYNLLAQDRTSAETASATTFAVLPLSVLLTLTILSLGLSFFNSGLREQRQAEADLRASEGRYRTLFESNPNPMWVFDLETLSFLAVNLAAVRHYGFSQQEFLARTIKDIRPAEDVPALVDDVSRRHPALDDTRRWRHRKKDGSLIDVEITSHELGWLGRPASLVLVNDVTARKRADEIRARLSAIVQSSDDAIVSKTLGGVITSWNFGAEKLFGYSASEAIGQNVVMLLPPDRVGEEAEIMGQIKQGRRVEQFDTVRVRKDGRRIDVSVTLSPILDENEKIIGVSKIARDISERKRAEKEVRQLNLDLENRVRRRTAELEAANKELEAFSYSVSHDLRSPLRTVDGFSQAVLEDFGGQLPEEGRRYLETIRGGAQRMGTLIDDLLTFSRLSRLPLNKQKVDMAVMARETFAELAAEAAGRKIELKIRTLPPVHGDAALLKQVWMNLISNAIKYTRKRDSAIVEIGCRGEGAQPIYFVADNGSGFDMQYVGKLFGVFQRLHRSDEFEGTGVGLAIVQRVIARHGGRIWAEGAVDHGATFYFTVENVRQRI